MYQIPSLCILQMKNVKPWELRFHFSDFSLAYVKCLLSPAWRKPMKLELFFLVSVPPRVALSFTSLPCFSAFNSFTTKEELGKTVPQLLTPGLMGESSESFSASEDEGHREYQANDSDSDGPILYTDDEDEDEDEDGSGESKTVFKRQGGAWVISRSSCSL